MAAPTKGTDTKDTSSYLHSHVLIPDEDLFRIYTRTRDCDDYYNEYNECTKKRGRKDQRYLYGKEINCDHFLSAYDACMRWKTTKDETQLAELAKYERSKSQQRLKGAMENNVWEYRNGPPADWNKPLMPDLSKDPDAIYFMEDQEVSTDNTAKDTNTKDYTKTTDTLHTKVVQSSSDNEAKRSSCAIS